MRHLREELGKLQTTLSATNRDLSTIRNEYSSCRADVITLQRTADDANDELRRKTELLNALDRNMHQLKTAHDTQVDEIQELRANQLQAQHKDGKECPGCRTLKAQLS